MQQTNLNIVKKNMLLTSELIKVMQLLEDNGIEALAFKGPILSQMAYGDVVSRQYADLDILVKGENKLQIVKLFNKLDYKTSLYISNFESLNVITVYNSSTDVAIELHWELLSVNYAIDISKINIFDETKKNLVFDQEIKTFNTEFLLIYLAIHA